MIYFIHGPDRLLARQAAFAITSEIDPDGANTSWLDGRVAQPDQLVNAVGAASFFGGPRVVVVSDLLGRTTREANNGESGAVDEDRASRSHPVLNALLSAVPELHVLILLEPGLAAAPAAIKSVGASVTIIASEPPRSAALVAWIEAAVRQAGGRIDRRTAQSLAETLFPQTWDRKPANPRFDRPPDMALLTQEIEKLTLAAHPDPITEDHIAEVVAGGPDQRVFRFLDATLGGDLRSAISELERLAEAGEEPAMLLAQILGQLELTTVASAASGKDAGAVARDLGTVTPARMAAVMASAQRRQVSATDAIECGVTVDRNLKSGRTRTPDRALQDVVLALASPSPVRKTGRPL